MISFAAIEKLFAVDLKQQCCYEIWFSVKGIPPYDTCWMGKMPDKSNKKKECYWFGLLPDDSQGYDFDNFLDFSNAPVFGGRSLKDIWDQIELLSINGCDPEELITDYYS